jgi:predicted nucleotidyltransferase
MGQSACYHALMSRADIIATLQSRAPDIRALGATSLYLFGSAARDQATDRSDVDLFVDYDPDRFSFVELIRLRQRLTAALGRPADLTTREGLHPLLRAAIEAEAIRVL